MKNSIKEYELALKNVKKFAKEKGLELSAYDFNFLSDSYNCELTWNPAYHKMPYSEESVGFGGERKTVYYTYLQFSQRCSSICCSSGDFDKDRILARLRKVRNNEKLDLFENLKHQAQKEGMKLFAITFYGDRFGLIKASDLIMDNNNHKATVIGGEYDGYQISTQGFFQLIGINSEMTKFIASKRLVKLEKLKGHGKVLSLGF